MCHIKRPSSVQCRSPYLTTAMFLSPTKIPGKWKGNLKVSSLSIFFLTQMFIEYLIRARHFHIYHLPEFSQQPHRGAGDPGPENQELAGPGSQSRLTILNCPLPQWLCHCYDKALLWPQHPSLDTGYDLLCPAQIRVVVRGWGEAVTLRAPLALLWLPPSLADGGQASLHGSLTPLPPMKTSSTPDTTCQKP